VTSQRRPWAYERGTLWVNEPNDAAPTQLPAGAPVTFREVRRDDRAALAVAMGLPGAAATEERFAGARRCFAAWDGEHIAAYGWASQGCESVGELERTFRLQPDESYIWDCVTLPDYRGRRLYSALLSYMLAELRRGGIGRVWIGASMANIPSIKGIQNAGFHQVISLVYVRLLPLRCAWMAGHSDATPRQVADARRVMTADGEVSLGPLVLGIDRDEQSADC
jgi:GNAT superfamily N-acetyltransferase